MSTVQTRHSKGKRRSDVFSTTQRQRQNPQSRFLVSGCSHKTLVSPLLEQVLPTAWGCPGHTGRVSPLRFPDGFQRHRACRPVRYPPPAAHSPLQDRPRQEVSKRTWGRSPRLVWSQGTITRAEKLLRHAQSQHKPQPLLLCRRLRMDPPHAGFPDAQCRCSVTVWTWVFQAPNWIALELSVTRAHWVEVRGRMEYTCEGRKLWRQDSRPQGQALSPKARRSCGPAAELSRWLVWGQGYLPRGR